MPEILTTDAKLDKLMAALEAKTVAVVPVVGAPTDPAAPQAVAAAKTKPGWQSTETWLTFAGTALLGTILEQLVQVLPELAKQPNVPAWLPGIVVVAIPIIAWVMKWNTGKYLDSRTALKLGAQTVDSDAAAAALVNK